MIRLSNGRDYFYDDFKALTVLGKYDITALRFAYQRQVEDANGNWIPVFGSLGEMAKKATLPKLKEYNFCTNSGVAANAGCRQFDIGTTYTDIIKNEIAMYVDGYKTRSFRNGRLEMNLFDDITHGRGVLRRFTSLRVMQEVYERIKTRFNLPDDDPAWEEEEFLQDINAAAPADLSEDEKAAFKIDLELMQAFEAGALQDADFYRDLVFKILPTE